MIQSAHACVGFFQIPKMAIDVAKVYNATENQVKVTGHSGSLGLEDGHSEFVKAKGFHHVGLGFIRARHGCDMMRKSQIVEENKRNVGCCHGRFLVEQEGALVNVKHVVGRN